MSAAMEEQKPKERRQMMSIFAGSALTREKAEDVLGFSISKHEWSAAADHYSFPGPNKPPIVTKTSRQRFKVDALLGFMGLLDDHLQRMAFGCKTLETVHGNFIKIDAIETTSSFSEIIRDYFNKINPAGRTCREDQCQKTHPTTRHFCLRERGHDGRCNFTPKNAISALSKTTKGQQKSYQGLDDEMVYKGTRNIQRLHEIHGLLSSGESEIDRQKMKERIDSMDDWHRSGFKFHVEHVGDRCCQCISCGLHSSEEPINCPMRGCHRGPCSQCEDSFQVISDLKLLAQKVLERKCMTSVEKERIVELDVEIDKCRQNLVEYRAHIVQKKIEAAYFREQIQSLTSTEAVVICDFKMKINPLYHREAMKDWYGKRGVACCGFLIYTKAPEEGEVYAEYFYFFSDDTCQDANMVLAAKSYIYNEHLPTLFPEGVTIQVKWETDGAGCFNSNLMKACQPMWYIWTDHCIDEVQIRHSSNGGGKSCLDGSFSSLQANNIDVVRSGKMDIHDARTCLSAFLLGPSMSNASAAILSVRRENDLRIANGSGEPILLRSHRIVLERGANQARCFTNSGYGEGTVVPFSTYESMIPMSTTMPGCAVTHDADDSRFRQLKTHSTESYYSRMDKARKSRFAAKREKEEERFLSRINEAKKNGIYLCTCRREGDLAPCTKQFRSENFLQQHINSGVHHYTGQNLTTKSAMLVSSKGGIFGVGRRMNRHEEHFSDDNIKDGVGVGMTNGADWNSCGCYGKSQRSKPQQKSLRMAKELISLFEKGESDSSEKKSRNKFTPQMALSHLRDMKNPSGMLTFSSTSVYGPLVTIPQIKAF